MGGDPAVGVVSGAVVTEWRGQRSGSGGTRRVETGAGGNGGGVGWRATGQGGLGGGGDRGGRRR